METNLGLEAFDYYGLTEIGASFTGECQAKAGIHWWEDYHLFEVLDPKGQEPVSEGEIVRTVLLPLPERKSVTLYEKIRLRKGDFVTTSAAVNVTVDDAGRVTFARLSLGGVGYKRWQDPQADRAIVGTRLEEGAVDQAIRILLKDSLPLRDNAYKEDLVGTLLKRLLRRIREGDV